ncbi:MAG: methanogenesis marker 15 protein [Methanothrix sp.]|jgi:putative methanogenesis marker protein 15|uniref:methanogenesis marker 15 protein n=1 Tax=Methanothrix sp. TaxID=90426 RepID=UPI00198ACA00|nr:methanogenesis marker 15 protein [Methanothrix sp.]MBC7080472.1 methanogenesis marker 15 protein [Methanothrix sp.]MDH7597039.1 methanogenesis marker 15 protein [Methanothrix sp.]NPU87687.1 methanogenesis marker 15 protein [Methanothrix sp.]
MIRIAQLSCGAEYSGIQRELERAAEIVGAKMISPEVSLEDVMEVEKRFGVSVPSGDLNLIMARATRLVQNPDLADAVFVATCFRCAEGAIIRGEVRRYIHEHSRLPVLSYSFTERTTAETLLTRMEALVTTARMRGLLARERQTGLTAGIDSGSTTTKAVIMRDNQIIGTGWVPTTEVIKSAEEAFQQALQESGVKREEIQGIGVTGYGRFLVGKHFDARLIQEEITVNSKGAVFLANAQKGPATVIDIGGMDNKAISVQDGVPGSFTMGGICAGASGRFLELTARRLGVNITDLGKLALRGSYKSVPMNSYCIVFGTQSLVNSLSKGARPEDVAMAACHSVAEQVFEQQLQEVEVKQPVIMVGGTSLIEGLPRAMEDLLGIKVIVPNHAQYIGAVGAALLVSGMLEV